jgi:short-subunit dehydrogenase
MLTQAIRGAVAVSNAGVGWSGSFASMSEREIDSLLDLNLRAAAHLAGAALAYLPPDSAAWRTRCAPSSGPSASASPW